MKCIFFVLVFFLALTATKAQTFEWAQKIGNTGNDEGYSITTDASGNVYTTGSFQGVTDFDPGPGTFTLSSSGIADVFVCKMDAQGNFLWARQWGGIGNDIAYSIAVDVSGNVYTTGKFVQMVDFDPGPGTFTLGYMGGFSDVFISKLDAAGNFVWAKAFGGTDTDYGVSLVLDASGNVYTTGGFRYTVDFDPGPGTFTMTSQNDAVFISKLDVSGNLVWAKQFSGGYCASSCITLDASGNICTIGYFNDSVDFDPGPGVFNVSSVGNSDVFVSKLDASGNFIWVKEFGSINMDYGAAIISDASGNLSITGYFQGTTDFDPGLGTYTLSPIGNLDAFISRLDASGNFIWVKRLGSIGSTGAGSISQDNFNNIFIIGSFQNTTDMDPGPGTFTLTALGPADLYILKLDASGNFIWAMQFSGTGYKFITDIDIDIFQNIYTVGYFRDTVDFDPGTTTTYTLSAPGPNGLNDIFIDKLSCKPVVAVNSGSVCSGASFTIIPGGAATYTVSGGSNVVTPISTGIYSVTGTSADGCVSSNTAISTVTVNPRPVVSVNNGSICSGQSFNINPIGASNYTVSGGSVIVSPTLTTTYSVTGISSFGCIGTNTALSTVTVNPLPNISIVTGASLICNGETTSLVITGSDSYTWSTGEITATLVISPSISTSYTIDALNSFGCRTTAVITQSVSECTTLPEIKNAINAGIKIYPNPNTGIFTVELEEQSEVTIYTILGEPVFKKVLEKGKNKVLLIAQPSGVYFVRVGGAAIVKIVKE